MIYAKTSSIVTKHWRPLVNCGAITLNNFQQNPVSLSKVVQYKQTIFAALFPV